MIFDFQTAQTALNLVIEGATLIGAARLVGGLAIAGLRKQGEPAAAPVAAPVAAATPEPKVAAIACTAATPGATLTLGSLDFTMTDFAEELWEGDLIEEEIIDQPATELAPESAPICETWEAMSAAELRDTCATYGIDVQNLPYRGTRKAPMIAALYDN